MASIEGQTLGTARARQLLRRTGFGAIPADIEAYEALEAGAAVDRLLAFKPSKYKPNGSGGQAQLRQHNNWVRNLLKLKPPEALREKLVLFWHDHFATGFSKVQDAKMMATQNQLLRINCVRDMRVLVKAMNVDPAMMEWLDTVRNLKAVPNENYGRELNELFTLGVTDLAGQENYTQDDIAQIARAFTGHTYDYRRRKHYYAYWQHDTTGEFPDRGPKVIFATKGQFGPGGRDYTQFPTALDEEDPDQSQHEIDNVIDILFQHRDSQGENTIARRTAKRLLEFFAHGGFANPTPALVDVIDDVVSRSSFTTDFNVGRLVREVLLDDETYASLGDPSRKSIKWPIDFYVGTLRLLKAKLVGPYLYVPGQFGDGAFDALAGMGQTLFDPPSVFGWDWEASWISSQTLLWRYRFATDVISARGGGFVPGKVLDLDLTDPGQIVDQITELLGVKDDLSTAERGVLVDYLGAGPIDLSDYDVRNRKLHGLVGLVIESPAYQAH